jgi:SAM-dependent methyltransferase
MLAEDKKSASIEKEWLNKTTYSDIAHFVKKYSGGKGVLDIGCGTGDLIEVLVEHGLDVSGLDPSTCAIEIAKAAGCKKVYNSSLEEFFNKNTDKFDAIILVNVLEHVPDPSGIIRMAREMLTGGGVIIVIVPNDFSKIQAMAKKKLGCLNDWWVAIPDHINYFNYSSLNDFMMRSGFNNIYTQGDFPMEVFLLAGQNYIGDRRVGKKCHDIRVKAEMFVPNVIRRLAYSALAKVGIGRDCFYVGRKV